MYNHVRRCLIVSVKIHRKFLTQSIHERVSSTQINHYIHRWNDATYKRFCSEAAIKIENNEANNEANISPKDLTQQKFDQFLSDPENKKLYDILQLEINVLRYNAERIPENIEPKDWLMLFTMKTKSKRKKYLLFLWKTERSKENLKAKKELKKAEMLTRWEERKKEKDQDTGDIKYGLFQNTLFLRIYPKTMHDWLNARLIRNMMFEPKLVFDCSYEAHMNSSEIHNCAKQLTMAFAKNRSHDSPMCFYFCNLNKDGMLKQFFHRNMPNLMDDDFPAFVTSQSYLEIFPKDQLVYLTPHCKTDMVEYDPDLVYIIGAMVDKSNPQPFSLAKAKRYGIRMAKLPLEKHLAWGTSSNKNLTIDQMTTILLDLKHTRNWEKALKQNVPCRKLKEARENALQMKVNKFSRFQAQNFQSQNIESNIQTQNTESNIQTELTFHNRKKM
ncbi:mitochondrial ribonuclease P protein 1 homolog [Linepithema humile]|uniref:mitochondrial ribonuclease P protein 1 homolog n=1 Tax=Linepithema humile TaxID=83485 RepID=UPI0006234A65|nr:PREDICTED: mitochondrial ribonuclease P protein 1 homolog [Linepithema humile]